MKVDFEKLKKEVSLPDFFQTLGWDYAPGSSMSSPKFTNGKQTIVVKKNHEGEYTFWDVHNESIRGKSIIDLMQQHIYDETGRMPTLREAGEAVQTYVNNGEVVIPQNSKYGVTNAELDPSQLAKLSHELKPYSGDFLAKRGIIQETLSSKVFCNVFYTREYTKDRKTYHNTCIKLVNTKGFQGISQRGIKDGKSFKGILGNKYSSVCVSHHDSTRPIEQLLIGESMIDCVSHYQMKLINTPKNILYVSSEGNLTSGQMELIKLLMDKHNINIENIHYLFDNDLTGYKYTLKLDAYLKNSTINIDSIPAEEIKKRVLQLLNVELPSHKDWNEDLQSVIELKLQEAVKNNDFAHLAELKDKGYNISPQMLKNIERDVPYQTMIAVQKLFGINEREMSSNLLKGNISQDSFSKNNIVPSQTQQDMEL